jgi:multimeric flavodoxin WrbA/nitrite reductase/ring-hydroxylating ferredoxin subunit
MEFVETINEEELTNGASKVISVKGKDIALFKIDNEITALGNSCLHKGGPLAKGKIQRKYDGYYVTCPWHGWEYNISNGKAPPGYDEQQSVYDVQIKNGKIFVSGKPIVYSSNKKYDGSLKDLIKLEYKTTTDSLNILGISTTNMNDNLERDSTSEMSLNKALLYAKEKYNASTVLLKLRDLEFRHCEGYYSINEQACTWPCSISEMDESDGMNEVYRKMILWSDIVIISTPIRWGSASSLYYKMIERLNCVQNQTTLHDRVLVKNKVASFIITGGQDNIQHVAGTMMVFFTELGFSLPPFSFMGWSKGWTAEDMENNIIQFSKSRYVTRSVKDLVDNDTKLLHQIKGDPCKTVSSPQPKIMDAPSKIKID